MVVAPVVFVGMLQLSGCVRQEPDPAPPGGVYRSESAGATFEQSVNIEGQEGEYVAGFNVRDIFRVPEQPDLIYIAADTQGIIFSNNDGKSWQVIPTSLTRTLDVLRLKNKVLVASGTDDTGQGFVVRSLDDGKSWQTVFTVPKPDQQNFGLLKGPEQKASVVLSIEPDPFVDDRVYAGSNLGTIFIGEQSAKTWKNMQMVSDEIFGSANDPGESITSIFPSPHAKDELYIITSDQELFRIKNGAHEEIEIPEFIGTPTPFGVSNGEKGVYDLAFAADFPEALVVGVEDGVVISRDKGKTWIQLQVPIERSQEFNSIDVAVSPTNANRLLVAINTVVYRSEDGGQTWNTSPILLPNHFIQEISINPSNAAKVLLIAAPRRT